MADPEKFAGHAGESGTEGQIVAPIRYIDHLGAIDPRRNHDRGDRIRVPLGRAGTELQAPGLHREAGPFRQTMVAGKDILQPLLQQHGDGFLQAIEHGNRRRIGEVAGGIGLPHVTKIEEHPGQPGLLVETERLLAGADDAKSGRAA